MSTPGSPSPELVTGLSGSRSDSRTGASGQDGSGDLRAAIANLLVRVDGYHQPAACHWDYADALLADGWVRAPDVAAEMDALADAMDVRANERAAADKGGPCEDECEEVTCHTVASVATWFKAAFMARQRAAALRGGTDG